MKFFFDMIYYISQTNLYSIHSVSLFGWILLNLMRAFSPVLLKCGFHIEKVRVYTVLYIVCLATFRNLHFVRRFCRRTFSIYRK